MSAPAHRLRAYMAHAGRPADGAALVLAHTARAAKRMAWAHCAAELFEEFTHVRITWLRDADMGYLRRTFTAPGVHYPHGCASCGLWSARQLNEDVCESCHRERIDASALPE